MTHKPPTRIRILGAGTYTGQYLAARLCELGYDVVIPNSYQTLPPYDRFYNIIGSGSALKRYILSDFTFSVSDSTIEIGDLHIIKSETITVNDFVNFSIYCWGMERGSRLPYDKKIEVTEDKIKQWKLTDLV